MPTRSSEATQGLRSLALVASLAFVAAACEADVAVAKSHGPVTGSVSGTIGDAEVGPGAPPAQLAALQSLSHVVVTMPDGRQIGVLHLAKPTAAGIPFTIDRLPLGVELHVAADGSFGGVPSPVPSGFFYLFQLQRAHLDDTYLPYYTVTLTSAVPHARGLDFVAEPLEVPPQLQPQPTPAASPTPAPAARRASPSE